MPTNPIKDWEKEKCWLWRGSLKSDGYGKVSIDGKSKLVHRVSYVLFKGRIPEGLQLDHLCRVRSCFNPNHLEAVTQRENILRGIGASATNARKTVCPKCGGKLTLIKHKPTARECVPCRSKRNSAYFRKWQVNNRDKCAANTRRYEMRQKLKKSIISKYIDSK